METCGDSYPHSGDFADEASWYHLPEISKALRMCLCSGTLTTSPLCEQA